MGIKDFFDSEISKIVFTILWSIIGLLLGYLEIGHLEEICLKKFNRFQKLKTMVKPFFILLGICMLFLEIFPCILSNLFKIDVK